MPPKGLRPPFENARASARKTHKKTGCGSYGPELSVPGRLDGIFHNPRNNGFKCVDIDLIDRFIRVVGDYQFLWLLIPTGHHASVHVPDLAPKGL